MASASRHNVTVLAFDGGRLDGFDGGNSVQWSRL
jgi:hypothetical protein